MELVFIQEWACALSNKQKKWETDSTVSKMPEIPHRKSDRYAKSGEEMMDILVDDIMRQPPLNSIE